MRVEGIGSIATSHMTATYRSPDWDEGGAVLHVKVDPETKAVSDFLSGKVPEIGNHIPELIAKMTF